MTCRLNWGASETLGCQKYAFCGLLTKGAIKKIVGLTDCNPPVRQTVSPQSGTVWQTALDRQVAVWDGLADCDLQSGTVWSQERKYLTTGGAMTKMR